METSYRIYLATVPLLITRSVISPRFVPVCLRFVQPLHPQVRPAPLAKPITGFSDNVSLGDQVSLCSEGKVVAPTTQPPPPRLEHLCKLIRERIEASNSCKIPSLPGKKPFRSRPQLTKSFAKG